MNTNEILTRLVSLGLIQCGDLDKAAAHLSEWIEPPHENGSYYEWRLNLLRDELKRLGVAAEWSELKWAVHLPNADLVSERAVCARELEICAEEMGRDAAPNSINAQKAAAFHASACVLRDRLYTDEARSRFGLWPETTIVSALTDVLLAWHRRVVTQHNLLSTATDEERRAVINRAIDWWNNDVLPILQKIGVL